MTALGLVLLALAAIPFVLALMNLGILRATPPQAPQGDMLVSILIPARNEAANIGPAVEAALGSMGVPVEVLVMDDGSTDATADIVRAYAARDSRVRLLAAPALDEGWTGKVHACHHLSEAARGTHFLFVDADVRLSPHAAASLAGHAQATDAGLVSAVPRQIMITPGELLTVPTINLLLLGYLPIGFMRLSRDPGLGAACGQLMLVEREAYRASGGHAAIRARIHDGIQLARLFRRKGLMTDLVPGERLATCRMYARFDEAWVGFAKNAHEGMATPVALPVWTVLLFGGHVLPFLLLPFAPSILFAWAALLSLGARSLVTFATRENPWSIPLHPLTILVGLAIQWSVLLRIGEARLAGWKGRLYPLEEKP
ncbi:glycosyltransferase [Microvirga lotononidis]|uniref:Glycosyl transferase n=1 Tax=Microvirga lotononidis TaxID=864069 RepID=I4YME4_9HYPH|nr:glycosyltransferase family 2 protein [Microvirga lotononidis]EIM25136.1 glycosyl transferase [Microvirga lotononidis]WQO29376.1 glycosyltransferase family 2 protein [Microvirga lotononidis]